MAANGHSPTLPVVTINNLHLQGLLSQSSNVVSFLGVTFAEIPARFRLARLVDPHNISGTVNASKYGPRCPQPVDGSREQRPHLYEGITQSSELPISEFQCLKVNVYAPRDAVSGASDHKRLPVIVWLHGGGFTVGDGNSEYTGEFLVERSIKLGRPCVYVGVNYRLGYFGFLSSKELETEARRYGEPYFSNQGLHDQRLALQWVQRNIHYFGGDGYNVTLAGESAGAWSVLAHLRSNVPVCQRAVVMSPPSSSFQGPAEQSQDVFDKLVASTGVPISAPDVDKLAALRDLSIDDLETLLEGKYVFPNWDPAWFVGMDRSTRLEDFDQLPPWLHSIAIGWTKDEYALWGLQFLSFTPEAIRDTLLSLLPDNQDFGNEILREYGIEKAATSQAAVEGLLAFGTESVFAPPALEIVKNHKSKLPVYVYRFDQVDITQTSQFKGYSYHSIDNVFFNQLPAVAGKNAPSDFSETAQAHSKAWIDFANGDHPWAVDDAKNAQGCQGMIFDGARSGVVQLNVERYWRLTSTKERGELFKNVGLRLLREKTNLRPDPKETYG